MSWDWDFVETIIPSLMAGMLITIQASLLGSALALVIGLGFALARRLGAPAIARGVGWVVDFVRGTPLLVQLYFLFYILPDAGIRLRPLVAGVIGLGLHYGSYISEVYRTGIDNLPRGQWEAAKALHLGTWATWRHVILPQAIPPMVPSLANYFIAMFKETPLLSTITVVELMSAARGVANYSYRYVEPMTLVGLFFLAISVPSVVFLRFLERRVALRTE